MKENFGGYDLLPHQEKFFSSQEKEVYLIGGFGAGKTISLVMEAVRLARENHSLPGMLTEPTYQMLDDILLPALYQYLERKEIKFTHIQSKHKIILEETESEIWLRSREKPLHLLGPNLAWCGSDEVTVDRSEKAHLILLSRVRHPGAKRPKIFGAGTPDGLNWFWERYIRDGTPDGVEIIKARTLDNPHLPEDYHSRLRVRYPPALVTAYLEGEFVPLTSLRVFPSFNPERHLDNLTYNPNNELLWSHDFNVDPLCSIVAQRERGEDGRWIYLIIDEIVLTGGAQTYAAAKIFTDRYGRGTKAHRGNLILYGDASGDMRSTSGSKSDFKILCDYLSRHWGKRVIQNINKYNPPLRDSILALNAVFESADGDAHIKLDRDKTRKLQESLLRTLYEEKSQQILKDGNEHLSDALRYLIFKEEPIIRQQVTLRKK
ncbi:MAG: phage terminase large subunit [Myxococcota bacterium]